MPPVQASPSREPTGVHTVRGSVFAGGRGSCRVCRGGGTEEPCHGEAWDDRR